jgi:threonine/homoserine/homoserine lactone efflux protein
MFVATICGLYLWYVAFQLLSQGRLWIQEAEAGTNVEVTARV